MEALPQVFQLFRQEVSHLSPDVCVCLPFDEAILGSPSCRRPYVGGHGGRLKLTAKAGDAPRWSCGRMPALAISRSVELQREIVCSCFLLSWLRGGQEAKHRPVRVPLLLQAGPELCSLLLVATRAERSEVLQAAETAALADRADVVGLPEILLRRLREHLCCSRIIEYTLCSIPTLFF